MPQTLLTDVRKNSDWDLCEGALEIYVQLTRYLGDHTLPELEQLHDILWELRRRASLEETP